jgi:hypothetical protein
MFRIVGTPFPQALLIPEIEAADRPFFRQVDPEPFLYIRNGCFQGCESIPFAAPGPSDGRQIGQSPGRIRHMAAPGRIRGQRPGSFQKRKSGPNGSHSPADTPVATDGSGHLESLLSQSVQLFRQIELHARMMESGQETGSIQYMVLRPVDPHEILSRHMAENGQRIGFLFPGTGFDDGLGTLFHIIHDDTPHFTHDTSQITQTAVFFKVLNTVIIQEKTGKCHADDTAILHGAAAFIDTFLQAAVY